MKLYFLTLLCALDARLANLRVNFGTVANKSDDFDSDENTGLFAPPNVNSMDPDSDENTEALPPNVGTLNEIPIENYKIDIGDDKDILPEIPIPEQKLDPEYVQVLEKRKAQIEEEFDRKKEIRDAYYRGMARGPVISLESLDYLEERSRSQAQHISQNFWDLEHNVKAMMNVHINQLPEIKKMEEELLAEEEVIAAAEEHVEHTEFHADLRNEDFLRSVVGYLKKFHNANKKVYNGLCLQLQGEIIDFGNHHNLERNCDRCVDDIEFCTDKELFGCPINYTRFTKDNDFVCISEVQTPADFYSAQVNCWRQGGDLWHSKVSDSGGQAMDENLDMWWVGWFSGRRSTSWVNVKGDPVDTSQHFDSDPNTYQCAAVHFNAINNESPFELKPLSCLKKKLPYFCEI